MSVKVTRAGWFNFEGFGRPYEGWYGLKYTRWISAGRAFTRRGAAKKAAAAAMRDTEALRV